MSCHNYKHTRQYTGFHCQLVRVNDFMRSSTILPSCTTAGNFFSSVNTDRITTVVENGGGSTGRVYHDDDDDEDDGDDSMLIAC